MQFEFATAHRIVFGSGAVSEAATAAHAVGGRALLVVGRGLEHAERLLDCLKVRGNEWIPFHVTGEPTIEQVSSGVRAARVGECDLVIACGGGSVLDAGKAIAAMMTNQGELTDYLEIIGQGKPLDEKPAPFIAIPTTAGTGAEVTRNAVLASPEKKVKVSLRSPLMLPLLAVVDPELTSSLPRALTASTGLDALTQLIEPFVCARANPMTDAFCRDGLPRVAASLRRACDAPDARAREEMALASLLGGLALANAGLGVIHGFAAPIGGMYSAPHGAVCAALLPHGMAINVRALRARGGSAETLRRYEEAARLLTGKPTASAEEGIQWVAELCRDLSVPPLRSYGIVAEDLPVIVGGAARSSSMKANPVELSFEELREVIEAALG